VADWFVSEAVRHRLADLDRFVALEDALISIEHQLHLADAIIYATAKQYNRALITTDAHSGSLPA
jgi:predicted nucleic acid-binding protein